MSDGDLRLHDLCVVPRLRRAPQVKTLGLLLLGIICLGLGNLRREIHDRYR